MRVFWGLQILFIFFLSSNCLAEGEEISGAQSQVPVSSAPQSTNMLNKSMPDAGKPTGVSSTVAPSPAKNQTQTTDICNGTGRVTSGQSVPAPGGYYEIEKECCGNGTNCVTLKNQFVSTAQTDTNYACNGGICSTRGPLTSGDSIPASSTGNTLKQSSTVSFSGDKIFSADPSIIPKVSQTKSSGGGASSTAAGSDSTGGSSNPASVSDKKLASSQQDRTNSESQNQASTAANETQRQQAIQQNMQAQQQALGQASGQEYEALKAQIASENNRLNQAIASCNAAMESANSSCQSANSRSISFPESPGGGRNALLEAEGQCTNAAKTFKQAANSCESAISRCNSACAEAGRSCSTFSSYATSSYMKMDNANHCRERARISIDKMDGKSSSEILARMEKFDQENNIDHESDEEKSLASGGENQQGSGSALGGLIGSDAEKNKEGMVLSASEKRDKDSKSKLNKLSTGTIGSGGSFGSGGYGSARGKDRYSKLLGSNGSTKGGRRVSSLVQPSGLSAQELIERLRQRSLASMKKYDDGLDHNINHDIFYGAARGHFIWQERHAELSHMSTPTFFYREMMPQLIDSGWQTESDQDE